eukprot:CAMPEP_0185031548 /NCGR_PEP_ID=MMETSP1103-20130426/19080_1 /TAXON_ID=36769 /ORGANISM="Paraphysomonas bandaiensis, Strain Caron Lab Isolate" /LENGTH=499 /DNA_ID=CAMNT_0027567103 /DNA_START=78 /DNA_END=1577 /DNA_ORIENTATION=+
MRAVLCTVLYSIHVAVYTHAYPSSGVRIADIPNPITHPEKCGRETVKMSVICDLSGALSKESKDVIEGRVMHAEGLEIGVAVVDRMIPPEGISSIDDSAKAFAMQLHDAWGVGDKEKLNGVLIFLSLKDRAVFISRGNGLAGLLSKPILDTLIEHMKPYLRDGDYGGAIEAAIVEIDLIVHGKSHIPRQVETKSYEDMGVVVVLVLCVAGFAVISYRQSRHERGLRRGQVALSQLMQDVQNEDDNRFHFSSCPICLEDFNPPIRQNGSDDTLEGTGSTPLNPPDGGSSSSSGLPTRPMALHCGHTFCYKCLEEYLRDRRADKTCPICREPVDPTAPRPPRPNNATPNNMGAPPGTSGGPPDSSSGSNTGPFNSPGYRDSPPSYDDCAGPSCQASSAPPSNPRFRYNPMHRSAPEVLFRMNRMRYLYPSVMTADVYNNMQTAVNTGSTSEFVRAAEARSQQVTRTLADIQHRREMAHRGSSGASRGFGGGSSGGGSGGRW